MKYSLYMRFFDLIIITAALLLLNAGAECGENRLVLLDCPLRTAICAELHRAERPGEPLYSQCAQSTAGTARITFKDIKQEKYLIRMFADTDANGKLSGHETYIDWKKPGILIAADMRGQEDIYISFTRGILDTGAFRFRITDIPEPRGRILAGFFRITNSMPEKQPLAAASFPVTDKAVECTCPQLPYGKYAVSFLHDKNSNNKADAGELRLPRNRTGKVYTALSPDKGMKYRETVFTLGGTLYRAEVSFAYGFFRTGILFVRIKGLSSSRGQVLVNLFSNKKGFPADPQKAFRYKTLKLKGKKAVFTFTDVPFGTYGAGAVHDANSNFKMDTNLFGVPREGYGASNDAKGRFGPPSFMDASFSVDRDRVTITINMAY